MNGGLGGTWRRVDIRGAIALQASVLERRDGETGSVIRPDEQANEPLSRPATTVDVAFSQVLSGVSETQAPLPHQYPPLSAGARGLSGVQPVSRPTSAFI